MPPARYSHHVMDFYCRQLRYTLTARQITRLDDLLSLLVQVLHIASTRANTSLDSRYGGRVARRGGHWPPAPLWGTLSSLGRDQGIKACYLLAEVQIQRAFHEVEHQTCLPNRKSALQRKKWSSTLACRPLFPHLACISSLLQTLPYGRAAGKRLCGGQLSREKLPPGSIGCKPPRRS